MNQEEHCQQLNYPQDFYQDLKIKCQNTTLFTKEKLSQHHSPIKSDQSNTNQSQCSFQSSIHQQNVQRLKQASIKYMDDCFIEKYDREEGFKCKYIYEDYQFQSTGVSDFQHLTSKNQLFMKEELKEWQAYIKENKQLKNMLRFIVPTFGITVGKQIAFIFYKLLKLKLQAYKEMVELKMQILPKFNCFLGFQDETVDNGLSCPVYEDINADDITTFAQQGIQQFNNSMYFAKQIKYMTLKKTKFDINGNILQKMLPFMKQISKTLFLSIGGISQSQQTNNSGLFSMNLQRQSSVNLQLQNMRSMMSIYRGDSRPSVPFQDDQCDFLSKKQKFM